MKVWKKPHNDPSLRTLRRQALEIVFRCNMHMWVNRQNSRAMTTLQVLNAQRRVARIYSFLRKLEMNVDDIARGNHRFTYKALLRFQKLNIHEQHDYLYR